MGGQLMYDIDTGSTDDSGSLTWTWFDPSELDGDPPRLRYRQPRVPEYNQFDLIRSQYRDRLQSHAEDRADDVDEQIERLEQALEDGDTPESRVIEAIDEARGAIKEGDADPQAAREIIAELQATLNDEAPDAADNKHVREALEGAIDATNALSREAVADTDAILESLGNLRAEFDIDTELIREGLLFEGFRPTEQELRGFLDFCVACTTGLDNIGRDGEVLEWASMPDDARRTVLQSLGETPQARINNLFAYATTIAQGLEASKKKR